MNAGAVKAAEAGGSMADQPNQNAGAGPAGGIKQPPPLKPMSPDERLKAIIEGQEKLAENIHQLYATVFRLEQIARVNNKQIEQLANREE